MAPTAMYDEILVPTDGSSGTRRAVEHAVDLADRYDARLHALYVVDTGYQYAGTEDDFIDWDVVIEGDTAYGETAVQAVADEAAAAGVETVMAIRESPQIHRAILDYAEDENIDLIAMGTHGRRGLERMFLGSVTERVVRTAEVPVLTVRMDEE